MLFQKNHLEVKEMKKKKKKKENNFNVKIELEYYQYKMSAKDVEGSYYFKLDDKIIMEIDTNMVGSWKIIYDELYFLDMDMDSFVSHLKIMFKGNNGYHLLNYCYDEVDFMLQIMKMILPFHLSNLREWIDEY
jgi:hypothetical protein